MADREENGLTALAHGDEITVEVVSPFTGRTRKLRAVFQRIREQDGTMEVYDPKSGHIRNFRPDALLTKHRKKKFTKRRKA